jgi:anthranilate synthase component 1
VTATATVVRVGAACDPAALQRHHPARYPFLLESSAHGRFDILAAFPGERLTRHADGRLSGPGAAQGGFLAALDAWFARETEATATHPDLPFTGGWFLFLAYELAAEIEPRLRLHADPDLPVATAVRVPAAVLRERSSGTVWLVAEAGQAALLDAIAADIAGLRPQPGPPQRLLAADPVEEEPATYLAAVARARRYIHDGDVFQANLSRAWHAALAPGTTPPDLHARLRQANPAPFAALFELGTATLVSCSPERLVEVRGGRIQTRPIAGTRPRGADPGADADLRAELLANAKERAEHVMLVDLERNDLSRVARPGTVRVPELMSVESYATVHHLVSNVEGELRAGVTPGQVIAAVFPGGTITGCPKVRCMEIIDELEAAPRGAYTGSLGYLGRDGSLDLNILIRTLVVVDGEVRWRAGAGIVSDSVPERELEETRAKARGLGRALGAA